MIAFIAWAEVNQKNHIVQMNDFDPAYIAQHSVGDDRELSFLIKYSVYLQSFLQNLYSVKHCCLNMFAPLLSKNKIK